MEVWTTLVFLTHFRAFKDHPWRFRSSAIVDLVATTSDLPNLMIWEWFSIVTLKGKCTIPFRSHKSTSKVSKSSANIVRVFFYILEVFHLKPKKVKKILGWNRILQKFHVCDFRSVRSHFWLVRFHWVWTLLSAAWIFLSPDL